CCQRAQRLLKTLHRDDPKPVRVLPRIACVVPRRHEECVHTRLACADRLLLDSADLAHTAVQRDLAGGGDLVAPIDVPSELLEYTEREREAGGWPADAVRVDRDAQRQT